ncbi:MAG: hypothetical protein AVDCRST_MAG89-628, partial [uncultured Gemmatimonadetes bacterium]
DRRLHHLYHRHGRNVDRLAHRHQAAGERHGPRHDGPSRTGELRHRRHLRRRAGQAARGDADGPGAREPRM